MPIRLYLISSHCLLLEGARAVIATQPGRFELLGWAPSPDEAQATLATTEVDVIVFDVDGERPHLLVLIEKIKRLSSAKILLVTGQDEGSLSADVASLGTCGVIDRHTTAELLLRALEKVYEGQVWLKRAMTGRLVAEQDRKGVGATNHDGVSLALLTEKERKVLAVVVHHGGEPGKAIAVRLHIGESTLRNHLTAIYDKLDVPNRNGLLAFAMQAGLMERLSREVQKKSEKGPSNTASD